MVLFERHFRYADGVVPNLLALTVTVGGWPLGIAMMAADAWPLRIAGFLLTSLALVAFAARAFSTTVDAPRAGW